MTTPSVTELPLHLEPMSTDPFLGGAAIRELDHRQNDGIDVRLLWDEATGQVSVSVFDAKTSAAFEIPVEHHEARDAFLHPFAHAAFRGIDCPSAPRGDAVGVDR